MLAFELFVTYSRYVVFDFQSDDQGLATDSKDTPFFHSSSCTICREQV